MFNDVLNNNASTRLDGLSFHSGLFKSLLHIEQLFGEAYPGMRKKIAVFDLDNTLLVGDVGNAVFAELSKGNHPLRFSLAEYRRLVGIDPQTAYVEAVRALGGFSLDYLIQTTKKALFSETDTIFCDGFEIPVPTPNLAMRAVVHLLLDWDYAIFVISASNDISAKIAGSMLFGIPVNNIVGIKTRVIDGRLTDAILSPVPVGEGKVAQYRSLAGDVMPMVVATDSEIDLPLLQICDPDGVAILVGATDDFYAKAQQEFPLTVHLHRLPGDNALFFQKHHRVA